LDWIHCDKCYRYLGDRQQSFSNITLTGCGHFLCAKCFEFVPGVRCLCPVCNVSYPSKRWEPTHRAPTDIL
jgi:hypothetical protein